MTNRRLLPVSVAQAWIVAAILAIAWLFPAVLSAVQDEDFGGAELELTFEGDAEGGEEVAPPEPEPEPAPEPPPKPKPEPKPKSPYVYRTIEDFNSLKEGERPGVVRCGESVPALQFEAVASAGGWKGSRCLTLRSVPAASDSCAWTGNVSDAGLKGFTGLSLRVRSSAPVPELKVGVKGGGYVFGTAGIGTDWQEVRFAFTDLAGRGRFDPASITEIAVAVRHEGLQPVDVMIDQIVAWKHRWTRRAGRVNVNAESGRGPGGWRADDALENCVVGPVSDGRGLLVSFWPSPVAYAPWRISAEWRELAHSLSGMARLEGRLGASPSAAPVLARISLAEVGGERFVNLVEVPAGSRTVSLPFSSFKPDSRRSSGTAGTPSVANGRLDAGLIAAWGVEIIPLAENSSPGTLEIQEMWAKPARSKAVRKPRPPKPKPKPKPKPEPEPEPAVEQPEEELDDGMLELE